MYVGPITILCLCLVYVGAMKLELKGVLEPRITDMFWSSVYSKEDAPIGNDDPYIQLEIEFSAKPGDKATSFDVLIYPDIAHVGIREGSSSDYCCTEELKQKNKCPLVGSAIYYGDKVTSKSIFFTTNPVSYNIKVPIKTSGIQVLQFTNCFENGIGNITYIGKAEWYNPYGYLPGENYMKLPMSGIFALLYMFIAVLFTILVIKHRKILLYIQLGILGVIVYAAIENASWYFYRLGLNNIGNYSYPALAFVVLLSSINRTVTRVLVLGIGMGLGVIKWTLGTTQYKVALLAVLYLLFTFLFQFNTETSALAKKETVPSWVSVLIIIPTAFSDTAFYYWIVLSIIRTIQQLTLRCQILKLDMYKKFLAVLVLVGILELIIMLYGGISRFFRNSINWKYTWYFDAFTEILYFLVIASIGYLWRPRSNNMRFGYAEFFTDDETNLPNAEDLQQDITGRDSTKKDATKSKKLTTFDKEILAINLPQEESGEETGIEMRKMD